MLANMTYMQKNATAEETDSPFRRVVFDVIIVFYQFCCPNVGTC